MSYYEVQSGKDAFELILCGAKAVQVGTCHRVEGPDCFNRIADELEAIMKQKGYSSIEQFRGKLKNREVGNKDVLVQGKLKAIRGANQNLNYYLWALSMVFLAVVLGLWIRGVVTIKINY